MPDESAPVQITKVIGGDPRLEGVVDYFCDHRNPSPEMFYKDKTYVAMMGSQGIYIHGKVYEEKMQSKSEVHIGLEMVPFVGVGRTFAGRQPTGGCTSTTVGAL